MKIKKVIYSNHPILGNLELDFTNPATGQPSDSILLAGENGTGKTSILQTISTFLNRGPFEFASIDYVVNGRTYQAIPGNNPDHKPFYCLVDDLGNETQIMSDASNNPQSIESNPLDIRHYGCVYSKARADYRTEQIQFTTTQALDAGKYDVDQEDNFTLLKQLIVDVENQSNSTFRQINEQQPTNPTSWSTFYPTSKIFRFKKAFDNFFEKIKYEKVDDIGPEKVILFKKYANSILVDKLSTGEKQIVFRGIYLLKNILKLNGAAIMVDEPELSMHPKWQKKILQYYKDLFTEGGVQKTQLFFSTHSDHVVTDALSKKDLVIVLNDDNGVIKAKRIVTPGVLPSISSAETNYMAFDIVSNDYHNELYGYLQDKTSTPKVKDCDTYIKTQPPYDGATHYRTSSFRATTYDTLSTFVRNSIHHPENPANTFTESQLRTSIELLVELCR